MQRKSRGRAPLTPEAPATNYRGRTHRSVRGPISAVLWCVSTALFVARCFLPPPGFVAGFFLACLAITLPISVWYPTLAVASFLLLIALLEVAGTYADLLVLLGYPLMGSLAAQRNIWWCLAYGTAFTALGFYSLEEQKFSADPYAITTHATLLVIAFFCGWWLRTELQRRYVKRAEVRRERDEMAVLTHNTVASELTSLVVRLEVLAMENPQLGKQLEACADSARRTISDARVLIETMRAATFSNPRSTAAQPGISIKTSDLTLRAHGFHTELDEALGPLIMGEESCQVLGECLSEITTNILKYGDRSSAVHLSAAVERGALEVCIENRVSPAPEHAQSNRMGLEIMQRQLDSVNGSLSITDSDETWQTTLSIPISDVQAGR